MSFDATGRMNETGGAESPDTPSAGPVAPHYRREWEVEFPSSFRDDLTDKPGAHADCESAHVDAGRTAP